MCISAKACSGVGGSSFGSDTARGLMQMSVCFGWEGSFLGFFTAMRGFLFYFYLFLLVSMTVVAILRKELRSIDS